MIVVDIYWNIDEAGEPVDTDVEELPITRWGPFDGVVEATTWMNEYPDDADIHDMILVDAEASEIDEDTLNDPGEIFRD